MYFGYVVVVLKFLKVHQKIFFKLLKGIKLKGHSSTNSLIQPLIHTSALFDIAPANACWTITGVRENM